MWNTYKANKARKEHYLNKIEYSKWTNPEYSEYIPDQIKHGLFNDYLTWKLNGNSVTKDYPIYFNLDKQPIPVKTKKLKSKEKKLLVLDW